jgi:hypothetical protein
VDQFRSREFLGLSTGGNFSKPPAFIYLGNIRDPARLEIWPFRVRLDWQSCRDLHPENFPSQPGGFCVKELQMKWEYQVALLNRDDIGTLRDFTEFLSNWLNERGQDGWELTAVSSHSRGEMVYLKRHIS